MKVIISAYACEPGQGSERGAGWNWSLAAAVKHEAWVMTCAHRQEAIEEALRGSGGPVPTFVYLELPGLRRWAMRERGCGTTSTTCCGNSAPHGRLGGSSACNGLTSSII